MSAAELGASMDSDSFIQRTEGDPEATLSPFSVSSNWMDDGNETNWNQFQQPGWQCLQHQSSDIRLVSERVLWWVFRDPSVPPLETNLIKPLLKSLLDNTKDKNTAVRGQSEHTIVNLLGLRQGEETMQSISAILDSASNELLSECHRRSLKKISSLPDSNEEIDDTILT